MRRITCQTCGTEEITAGHAQCRRCFVQTKGWDKQLSPTRSTDWYIDELGIPSRRYGDIESTAR